MKILILVAALLLACAIVHADTYTKIDPTTVRVQPSSSDIAIDNLKGQVAGLRTMIARAQADIRAYTDRTNADIAFWQARIDEIVTAVPEVGVTPLDAEIK